MPFTIIAPGQIPFGKEIHFETIVQMVQNFCDKTYKMKTPNTLTKVDIKADSHAALYSKNVIDDLFKENVQDNPDGLRIYFGLHQHTVVEDTEMTERPESYIGQHTTILVCTSNGKDLLNVGNSISFAASGGNGVEEGQICPPPACGDAKIDSQLK